MIRVLCVLVFTVIVAPTVDMLVSGIRRVNGAGWGLGCVFFPFVLESFCLVFVLKGEAQCLAFYCAFLFSKPLCVIAAQTFEDGGEPPKSHAENLTVGANDKNRKYHGQNSTVLLQVEH